MYSGSDDVVAMLEALAALGVDVVVSLQAPSNGSEARRWLVMARFNSAACQPSADARETAWLCVQRVAAAKVCADSIARALAKALRAARGEAAL